MTRYPPTLKYMMPVYWLEARPFYFSKLPLKKPALDSGGRASRIIKSGSSCCYYLWQPMDVQIPDQTEIIQNYINHIQ